MALAVVLVLLVVGSLYFHFASPWYFTELASNWGTVDFTVDVTFWVCGIVFVAVNLFTAYCVWRFRARPGKKDSCALTGAWDRDLEGTRHFRLYRIPLEDVRAQAMGKAAVDAASIGVVARPAPAPEPPVAAAPEAATPTPAPSFIGTAKASQPTTSPRVTSSRSA